MPKLNTSPLSFPSSQHELLRQHQLEVPVNSIEMTLTVLRQLQEVDVELERWIKDGNVQDKADSGFKEKLESLRKQRENLSYKLSPFDFSLYERIRAARGGIGVAQVRGISCMKCHIHLPPQLMNDLRRFQTIQQCPSCKRILDAMP